VTQLLRFLKIPILKIFLCLFLIVFLWKNTAQAKSFRDKCYLDPAPSRKILRKWFCDF